ncbi:MAG: NADH-quinone oxidoreductase subunit NuoE [Halanaerobiaceae bacterium]
MKEEQEVIREESEVLLEKLHDIQDSYGYIPESEIDKLAEKYQLPRARLYGVIRFYSMLYTEPTGKYIIRICDSLSCHLNDSENLLKTVENYLDIEQGETTDDSKFTLEVVECLGYCGEGPVMMVNDEIHTNLTSARALQILKNCV